jgi:hypothetical protein
MLKRRIGPAISDTIQYNEVKSKSQTEISHFETKEEFISYLIEKKELTKDTHHSNSDGFIYLKGVLKIDKRVKSGLNWSDVVVTSAIVEDGQISKYHFLPMTYKGIKTKLKAPDIVAYMKHNNFDAQIKNNFWHVKTFRIPESAEHLDFSSVKTELTLFYGKRIELSKLPIAGITLGLGLKELSIDCPNAYNKAKEKGCGRDILTALQPRSFWSDLLGCMGCGSAANRH